MKRNRTIQLMTIIVTILIVAVFMTGCEQAGQASGDPTPTAIQILFKLDPRLLGPTYGGARWVSPPTYGPILHPGSTYALEARAEAVDSDGQRLPATIEWIPEDTEMVTVLTGQGDQVTINIQRAGESRVQILAQGASKTLTIKAAYRQNDAMEIQVIQ